MNAREFAPEVIEAAAQAMWDRIGGDHVSPSPGYIEDAAAALSAAADALYETVRAEVLAPVAALDDRQIRNLGHTMDEAQSAARFRGQGEDERDVAALAAIEWLRAVLADPDAVTA